MGHVRCSIPNFKQSMQGKHIRGFYYNSRWCSLKWINNLPYKHRVETFIFNNDYSAIYASVSNNSYRIPGGHIEPKVSKLQQAINECREEARIIVNHMKYMGSYIENKNCSYGINAPIEPVGQFVEVYTGEFHKYYNGTVFTNEIDIQLDKNGKFHYIGDILPILKESHKRFINLLL